MSSISTNYETLDLSHPVPPACDQLDPYLRILKANVYVRDHDRSIAFYVNQLGFSVVADGRSGVPASQRCRASSGMALVGPATARWRGGERLVQNSADGAGATPALRATAQAVIDLSGRARRRLAGSKCGAHVVVGEHVAGTHDHRDVARPGQWFNLQPSLARAMKTRKEKSAFYSHSKQLITM